MVGCLVFLPVSLSPTFTTAISFSELITTFLLLLHTSRQYRFGSIFINSFFSAFSLLRLLLLLSACHPCH